MSATDDKCTLLTKMINSTKVETCSNCYIATTKVLKQRKRIKYNTIAANIVYHSYYYECTVCNNEQFIFECDGMKER